MTRNSAPTPAVPVAPSDPDAEAAFVCGGVALAGSRRVLRGYRSEIWLSHICQAAVGISCMVMSVVLLCFMVDHVNEGKTQFDKSQTLWATAFACTTLHLVIRPFSLVLFLLVPCFSRPRLHGFATGVHWMSFNLNISMFINVLLWRLNFGSCDLLDQGPDDLLCGDAQRIGVAAMVLQLGLQLPLDIWNFTILRRLSGLHRDPVMHEVLSSEMPSVRRKAVVRWLLKEKVGQIPGCATGSVQPLAVNYDHKKVDIELMEVGASEKKSWWGTTTAH